MDGMTEPWKSRDLFQLWDLWNHCIAFCLFDFIYSYETEMELLAQTPNF